MTLKQEFLVGKRVTVLGLGIEGVDLVRYLASHGASVTVSDTKSAEALASRIRELESLPVRFSLGENRLEDAVSADLLFVSQGVPLTLPAVRAARERGVAISSMTRFFLERCPGPVLGRKPTPALRSATTTAIYEHMTDDMDSDAGTILAGEPVAAVGERIFDTLLAVASGQPTKSEAQGLGDEEFAPWDTGPGF